MEEFKSNIMQNLNMEAISDTSMASVGHTTDNEEEEEEDYNNQVLAGESQSPANTEDFAQFAAQFLGQEEESSSSAKDKGKSPMK